MSIPFTGALAPKKKAELQTIAASLQLHEGGTKEELQSRIKAHLDTNQSSLEEHPTYAGLYGRKRRTGSVQPAPITYAPGRFAPTEESSPPRTRRTAIQSIREESPVEDPRDVSAMLKSSPKSTFTSPIKLPPIPLTVARAGLADVVDIAKTKPKEIYKSSKIAVNGANKFLSNATILWCLTASMELSYLLYAAVPWRHYQIHLSTIVKSSSHVIDIPYPAWHNFSQHALHITLIHWAIPTLIIPAICAVLVSFQPSETSNSVTFDPLTASIVRLAAQAVYPIATVDPWVWGSDVLGREWRVVDAAMTVAFAFSEAILRKPNAQVRASPSFDQALVLATPQNQRFLDEAVASEVD